MRLWGIAALALVTACYSMSTLQEPKPLPQGAVRGSVGLGSVAAHHRGFPDLQLALRVGLIDRVESRLKLVLPGSDRGVGGVEAGINILPVDSQYVGLFLMPHYRYYRVDEDFDDWFDESGNHPRRVHAFAMPTLAVFHLPSCDLFVGPDLQAGTRQRRGMLAIGGHLGTSFAAGRYVHLTVETGIVGAVAGTSRQRDRYGDLSQQVLTVGDTTIEIAFSVSVGSPYR
jgi:hypothetical protein